MDEFGIKKKGFSLGETDKERRNNLIIIILSVFADNRNCGFCFAAQ